MLRWAKAGGESWRGAAMRRARGGEGGIACYRATCDDVFGACVDDGVTRLLLLLLDVFLQLQPLELVCRVETVADQGVNFLE